MSEKDKKRLLMVGSDGRLKHLIVEKGAESLNIRLEDEEDGIRKVGETMPKEQLAKQVEEWVESDAFLTESFPDWLKRKGGGT